MSSVKIIECPRDAMQGIKTGIPTELKVAYLQALLSCGFDTLDFGSFVSPRAIPQMADTAAVLTGLDLSETKTKLLAIVANLRGAEAALDYEAIEFIGYPFSISENFQMRNTHKTIDESMSVLSDILSLADHYGVNVVTYLSMGFGNPYGDPWSPEIVAQWTETLAGMGCKIISLSDTVGAASPEVISELFNGVIPQFPEVEFGAHLHTAPHSWREKVHAAYAAGCRRFDGAIQGFGGCPMAKDELTGNMPTEKLLSYCAEQKIEHGVHMARFESAFNKASDIFLNYH
ncbi:MAG: hydroxymethylglutaryl-CoA lyase [Bacteroidetes bacterium]|mgnify:FL=1|jgi:hydroxymethylglutaryl-CoA lyase|nr:hydroxymethylglutaryl-CoA lyase [Flavobacteriaceae bacterium]MDA0719959.1 hydroxymethylglutaryl-CoA lyase [Bacteroidota bacterium]MDA0863278.1 hydroxymethylglutaryl-CoA lyase [Bacteroidota bacterium]HCK04801.1 hydroxymethylglutaryl-CoA lyase [Flavobacteriaceae bacterium]